MDEACRLETENNQLFTVAYNLESEIEPTVRHDEITLSCNPSDRYGSDKSDSELEALLLADTMREFISYAVGCMLGRYSLDKPGLILANQGETADDYRQQIPEPTFAPDEDNVIPLLDGDWFEDDITERFKAFLKVTFGTEHYEENLTFLENALYPDNLTGKKRKTIRDYFLKEFYNHHIKLYKKRPIYWLFSSKQGGGPGSFNALIYMHRYREDTVSIVLNDYLREFQTKLRSKIGVLQTVADNAAAAKADKTKAIKEIANLEKQLKELEDYERDVLYPLATRQVEIDLDDGVKVNYNKFGKALKKITGVTGKA
ncbi:MAG: class I SAM-dependent DNA methyltransferase [Planctomycetaceae bacterium]|nr:class I SAM-dependent DNA methyltransferase [Planctomycetaceae bacterium]